MAHFRPVCLRDVPLSVRCAAARLEGRRAGSAEERAELLAAALNPSGRVYWIAEKTA